MPKIKNIYGYILSILKGDFIMNKKQVELEIQN